MRFAISGMIALISAASVYADPPVLGGLDPVTAQESEIQGEGPFFRLFQNVTIEATNSLQGGNVIFYGLAAGDSIELWSLPGSDLTFRNEIGRYGIFRDGTRLANWQRSSINGYDGITIIEDITPATLQEIIRSFILYHQPDPPVEQRNIFIRVTDGEGERSSAGTTSGFGPQSDTPPFSTPEGYAVGDPALGDLDDDGDLDMVLGRNGATFDYFENTGDATNPVFEQRSGAANPFDGIDLGLRGRATLGDLDGDDDLDLIAGDHTGLVAIYRNTGTAAAPEFERLPASDGVLDGQDFGDLAEPHIADFSGDGSPDVIIASLTGGIRYFLNTTQNGELAFVEQTGEANPFSAISETGRSGASTTSFDNDGDGDLDLLVAWQTGGELSFFENAGSAQAAEFINRSASGPQSVLGRYGDAGLAVADLEQDGLWDLVAAVTFGQLRYHPGSDTVPTDASIMVSIIPENDPPRGGNRLLRYDEDVAAWDMYATLRSVIVDNEGDDWSVTSVDDSNTVGSVFFDGTTFTYQPEPGFNYLSKDQQGSDSITYTVADVHGAAAQYTLEITIIGQNDPMTANDDRIEISEDSAGIEFVPLILANDTDPDLADQIRYRSVDTTGLAGLIEYRFDAVFDGWVYSPNGAFEALALGQQAVDRFVYTARDSGSRTDSAGDRNANVDMVVIGANDAPVADDDTHSAVLGDAETDITAILLAGDTDVDDGAVLSILGIDTAGTRGNVRFDSGRVYYAPGSRFVELVNGGSVEDTFNYTLADEHGAMDVATVTVSISTGPLLRSAILPSTRSGVVGGDVFTAFATLINGPGSAASNCTISVAPGSPVTMSYREVDGANQPIGLPDPVFTISENSLRSFVLAFTPLAATGEAGLDLPIRFQCDEGAAPVFRGVNTLLISISDSAIADIIAIGATPSADGVLRVANDGGREAMAAAAVNIGATDTITVSLDNGFGVLPSRFTLCQTSEQGACLAPRSSSVEVEMASDPVLFSILAVDEDIDRSSIPDDPANARLYLRFRDATGRTRGLTSVGYAAGPAGSLDAAMDTAPFGIWSGTEAVRTESGSNSRAIVFSLPDGRLLMASDRGISLIETTPGNYNVRRRNLTGSFTRVTASGSTETGSVEGFWFPYRQLQLQLVDPDGDFSVFNGVADERTFERPLDLDDQQQIRFGDETSASGLSEWGAVATISHSISLIYLNPATGNYCRLAGPRHQPSPEVGGLLVYHLTTQDCPDLDAQVSGYAVVFAEPDLNGEPRLKLAFFATDRAFVSTIE